MTATPIFPRRRLAVFLAAWITATTACGAKEPAADALPRFDAVAEIGSTAGGDASRLGVVADAGTDLRGRVLVLDVAEKQLAVFSAQGEPIERVGRAGSGPGELGVPVALAVDTRNRAYVLDLARGSLVVFDASGERIRNLHDLPLHLPAIDICTIGERLFVLGAHDGQVIHEISPGNGGVVRSLAPDTGAADPVMGHARSSGYLACGPGDTIAFLPANRPEVLRFSAATGEPIGRITIPDYRAVQITRQADGGVRFRAPDGRAVDTGSSIAALPGGRHLVQVGPVVAGGLIAEFGPVRTFVVRWSDGSIIPLRRELPRVVSLRDDRAFTAETDPQPVVRVLRVRDD